MAANQNSVIVDFTGITPSQGGIAILPEGYHTGTIAEARVLDSRAGNPRLYIYFNTGPHRHRETFEHTATGRPFLMSLLISAGMDGNRLKGRVEIPFTKLIGRTVYFHYEPPRVDDSGKVVKGSWASYDWYTKAQYDQLVGKPNVDVDLDGPIEAPTPPAAPPAKATALPVAPKTNGAGKTTAPTAVPPVEDDFSFLDEG